MLGAHNNRRVYSKGAVTSRLCWIMTALLAQTHVTQKLNAVNTLVHNQTMFPLIWKLCKLWHSLTMQSRLFATSLLVVKWSMNVDFFVETHSGALAVEAGWANNEPGQCCSLGQRWLNLFQHKQYQCHHFFSLWLVATVAVSRSYRIDCASCLMFMHKMVNPSFPHPPLLPLSADVSVCSVYADYSATRQGES